MDASSIASRRLGSLPHFSLPPPPPSALTDIPSMRYPNLPPSDMSNPSQSNHGTRRDYPSPSFSSDGPRGMAPTSPSSLPAPYFSYTTSAPSTSILTPPISGALPDGIGPAPSGGSSNNSQSPGGHPYYQSHGSWPTPVSTQPTAYSYSSSAPQQTTYVQRHYQSGLASPSLQQYSRSSPTLPNGEHMTHANSSPYQDQQQSFPSPIGGGSNGAAGGVGEGASSILGSSLSSHPQVTGPSQPSTLGQPMLGAQPSPVQQLPSPVHGHHGVPDQSSEDNYRHPSTQGGWYPPASASQQASYPAFVPHSQASPAGPSPTASAPPLGRGLGAISGMAPPPPYMPRPNGSMQNMSPYQGYPGHNGAVLNSLPTPGAGLTIITGPPYGHHQFYLSPSQHPPQQERPFKCDQCPQSFNRNHDLKRHKRIHLSVKPFPCLFCDKSFSRKDALKRHKLVKGCGGDGEKVENGESTSEARTDDNTDPALSEGGAAKEVKQEP